MLIFSLYACHQWSLKFTDSDSFTFMVYLFVFQVLIIMGDLAARTKALMDFSQPKINDIQSSIVRPAITANTFEINPDSMGTEFSPVWGFSNGRSQYAY